MLTLHSDRCIRCGLCVKTCPMGLFSRGEEGTVTLREAPCLDCFHCTAACPAGAITHSELGTAAFADDAGDSSTAARLRRRRSIRHFGNEVPSREVLQAALDGAAYAPSAKNRRAYRWTVVLGQDAVNRLYRATLDYAAGEPNLRHLVWLDRRGYNPVTCGAPCLLLVHAPIDPATASHATDAVIAMTLAEQLLNEAGLGTCWGGYFRRAADKSPALRELLSIPADHEIHGVLMVGRSEEHFARIPYRAPAQVNWVE